MCGISKTKWRWLGILVVLPVAILIAHWNAEPVYEDDFPGISVTKSEYNGELVNVRIHFWNTSRGILTLNGMEHLRQYKGRVRALLSDLEDIEPEFQERESVPQQ